MYIILYILYIYIYYTIRGSYMLIQISYVLI